MLKELLDLKSCGATGIKLEFESEYTDWKSAFELSELVHRVDMDLCVKLGGLSSIQDLHICKELYANSIVAPMVESAYGAEKFLSSVKQVFDKSYPNLYLNIETKSAFEHLDEIVEKSDKITGFVLGRSDLKKSLGIAQANSDEILEYCNKLDKVCETTNKQFVLGGKINPESIHFMEKLPHLTHFETRKVIFEARSLNENSIEKALVFELNFLKRKTHLFQEDLERIEFIEKSLKMKV